MDTDSALLPDEPLPEAQRRPGQDAMIRVALANTVVGTVVMGSMATLFVLSLGGTAHDAGIRLTIAYLAPMLQLVGLLLIARVGKARLAVWGRSISLLPLAALAAIAVYGHTGRTMVVLAIVAMACLNVTNVVGNTGWWPLLQDVTAGESIGAFFSRMRIKLRVLEVGLPLLAGVFLTQNSPPGRFVVPIAIGMVGAGLSAYFMRAVPERVVKVARTGLYQRFLDVSRLPTVRSLLIFVATRDFIAALPCAFWIVMWRDRGLSDSYIMWMIPVGAAGNMVGLSLWARMVERHGSRPLIGLTIAAEALMGFAWFIMPYDQPTLLLVWAILFNGAWGFLEGGFLMGRTQAMMTAIPVSHQADAFTLMNLLASAGGALGALIGTECYSALTRNPAQFHGFDQRIVFLAGVQILLIGVWIVSRRLHRYAHETSTARFVGELWRSVFG